MRKLNRKGFTLIELLAVIVILAVVMGIAITSVLSSMNKARAGAIGDTAMIIANAFNQKYTESLVGGSPSKVYSDVKDQSGAEFKGYDFTGDATYYLYKIFEGTFSISSSTYELTKDTPTSALATTNSIATGTVIDSSFVSYNAGTGKFTVCMVVGSSSPNYVYADAVKTDTALSDIEKGSTNSQLTGLKLKGGYMMACSDGAQTSK